MVMPVTPACSGVVAVKTMLPNDEESDTSKRYDIVPTGPVLAAFTTESVPFDPSVPPDGRRRHLRRLDDDLGADAEASRPRCTD